MVNVVEEFFRQKQDDLINHNQDTMSAKCGRKGTGKSYSTMIEGQRIRGFEYFDVKKHIACFDPYKFLKMIRKSKKGDFVIFDDAGVGMDNREWAKKSNIIITKLLQTFRTKNLNVTFTVPDFAFVDIKARKLFDYFIQMKKIKSMWKKINGKDTYVTSRAKWYDIKTDSWSGDLWRQTLNVMVKGRPYEIDEISYSKLDDYTARTYEEMRNKASEALNKKADEITDGNDRAVPIEQAAKLLQMKSSQSIYGLVADGQIPIYRDSTSLKIPMAWIKATRKVLKIKDYSTEVFLLNNTKEMKVSGVKFNNGKKLIIAGPEYYKALDNLDLIIENEIREEKKLKP